MKVFCILGTLGSGKTSVLNCILPVWKDQKMLVVVNDVGMVNVDARRINHTGEMKAMTAGCIGCNDFTAFQKIFKEAIEAKIDIMVVEPTGIADGREIVQAVTVDAGIAVHCLTLVDVAHFPRNRALNTLPTQLEVSQEVLLTWTEANDATHEQALEYIAKHAPGVRINSIPIWDAQQLQSLAVHMTSQKIKAAVVNGVEHHQSHSHKHSDHGVFAYSILFKTETTFEDLVLALAPLRNTLVRAKGIVNGVEFDFVQGDLVQRERREGVSEGNFIATQPLPDAALESIRKANVTDDRTKKERMRSSDDISLEDTLEAIRWQLGQYPSVKGYDFLRVDFEADVAYQLCKRPGVPVEVWQEVLQKYFHMRILAGQEIVSGKWDSHPDLPYWKRRVGMNLAWHMKNYASDLTEKLHCEALLLNPASMALQGLQEIEALSFVEEMAEERPEIIKEVIEFGMQTENITDVSGVISKCIALSAANTSWQQRWQQLL